MPTFKYEAKNFGGKKVTGSIQGSDQENAVAELRKRNLVVLAVRPVAGGSKSSGGSLKGLLTNSNPDRYKSRGEELVIFTRQLSTMVAAGIPLVEGLEILQEQAENPGFAAVLDNVVEDIRSGGDLSNSLRKYPNCFEDIYVAMVHAGEVSGQLDEILVRLAEFMEASEELRREIKAAMTYPVVSLVLVIGITLFLMLYIVPQFRDVFDSMSITLPALTENVLNLADWMKANIMIQASGVVAIFVASRIYRRSERGKIQLDWLKLHVPVFGPLFRKVALSRFSKTFSTLVSSGVPILESLEIVSQTVGNHVLAVAINRARESVRQGDTLSEPLGESNEFPPMVVKMIGIGERSGALEHLLDKISEFYDAQVKAAVKSLTSLIEPIMISVMGFLVGTIVLAVFLPIFELQKQLANRG